MVRMRCWKCKDLKSCVGEVVRLLLQACECDEESKERRQPQCR